MAQEIATLRHANTDPADVASKTRISDLEDELQELLLEYSDMVETSHDKAVLAAKLNRSTPKGDRIKQAELEKTNAEVRAGRDDIELILETAAGEHYVEDADDDESDDGTEKKGTEPTDDSAEGGASSADEQGADSGDAATGESGDKGKDEDEDKGDAPSGDETSTDSDKPAGTDSEERPEGFEEETTLLDRARKRVGKAVTRLVGLSVAAYSARRSRKTEDTPDSQRAANESGDTTADETQQREASEANSTPVDSPDDAGLDQKLFEMGKPVEPLRRKATKWTGEPFAVRPKGPVRGEKADATKEKTGWLRSERGRKAAAALAIVASAGLSFFASQHSNNEAPAQKPAAVETTVDDAAQGSSSPTTEAPLAVDGGGVAATDTEIAPSDAGSEQVTLAPDGADGEYGPVIDSLSDEVRVIERGEGGFQTLAELGVPAQDRERVWEQVGTYLASAGRGDLVYRMDDGKWGWSNSGTLTDETLALILQGMNSTSSTGASELPETN
ncbi:hypothetical protein CR983_03700 [Candidatus Saccharibacteria bacterium]|nr:MAG: hypothetical protein CR983_03700 [Candidatus Saccharibacteria bacterium]